MTREEAIKKLESLKISLPAAKDEISGIIKLIESPWISVKDDLPCNHEDLLHPLYANFTKDVLVIYENKYISLERMIKDDKGNWKFVGNVLYWMPIPEPPKE